MESGIHDEAEVEKVARAMWARSHEKSWNDAVADDISCGLPYQFCSTGIYLDDARAALSAIDVAGIRAARQIVESRFIKAVRDLEPCLSVQSEGDPDPAKRFAGVRLEFSGESAIDNANALMDLLLAEIETSALSMGKENGK